MESTVYLPFSKELWIKHEIIVEKNKLEIDLLFPVLFISLTEDLSFEIHSRSPARACKIRMKKDEKSNPIFLITKT